MTSLLSTEHEFNKSGLATQPFDVSASLRLANMAERTVALADLASIEVEDADTFLAAAEHARAKSYFHYFPRLHFHGRSRTRMLRWERHAGSVLVYEVRRRKVGLQMNLYLPPFPFEPAALRHARQRMRDFNGDRSGRIMFVEEGEALRIARAGFEISLKWEEFIYDRATVMALGGAGFKKLRQELSRALKSGPVETRPYTMADQSTCLALAGAWRERLNASGMKVGTSYSHTVACLTAAERFPPSLLKGLVVEVDGEVRGFAFSGPITSTSGCNYLGITDHSFRGFPSLLCYRLMAAFPDLSRFNDSHDAGRPGLRETKQRFRPVEMHGIFSARER
jgi:hypothetical protein